MSINVLHLSARADMGGGPRHIQHLLESMTGQVNCFVACPDDKPFSDIFKKILGAKNVVLIPHRKITIRATLSLLKYVRLNNIQMLHCHGKGASVYGKLLRLLKPSLKLVYTPHGIHLGDYTACKRFLYLTYENLSSFLFSHLIYVSRSEKRKAELSRLFLRNRSTVIPNGVPPFLAPGIESPEKLRKSLFTASENKIIITCSSFNYMKNMDEALEIAALLPCCNFLWLGTGMDYEAIREKVKLRKLTNICMPGVKTNVNDYLLISDAYLSTSRWEGMPLSLLEAMAAGIPIIGTNVTGNKDVITEINGLLYESGDVPSAVQKIKHTLASNIFCKTKIQQHFLQNHSAQNMAASVIALYKSQF